MISQQTEAKFRVSCLVIVFIGFLIAEASIAQDISQDIEAGKALFQINCASCHGENGDGNGAAAEELILKPRDFALSAFKFDTDANWERGADEDLTNVIKNGAAVYGGSTMMVPWSQFSDQQIKGLVSYIRSLE